MTPPPHICGRQTPTTSVIIRADRAEWIIAQRNAGVGLKDIAAALGISIASASRTYNPRHEPREKEQPGATARYRVTGRVCGVKHATTIRAADRAAAEDRFRRAYPGAEGVRAERLL